MPTPWDARAVELEPTHGDYCHFAAWEEWVAGRGECGRDVLRILEADSMYAVVALYGIMNDACNDAAAAPAGASTKTPTAARTRLGEGVDHASE